MTRNLRLSMKHFRCEFVLWIFLMFQNVCLGEKASGIGWTDWSMWDSCSTQCEYGISTRTRQCLQKDASDLQDLRVVQVNRTICNGTSVQIKVCKFKACPPEQKSPHQTACSQYDSRMFSGRQYVWEPFIHANDACKQSCRAKGVHFYANLPDKADDGSPCKLGIAEAVCIQGVCKRVGCDGIVESGAVKDTCGVCGGDGSSCQTISGIFTSTSLKRGLNYVISMPAGSTNINITELQASRNLLVLQTETGKTFINENTNKPVSGVVEAAGTSFTYSGKSASSPKESIISPGPTNMSVILKLLMRGSNPSIMYTFSVPKAVSELVIQQIRRHSQPIELPPETNENRNAQLQVSNKRQPSSALSQKLSAGRTTNSGQEMSRAGIEGKTFLELSSTKPAIIVDDYPNFSTISTGYSSRQGGTNKSPVSVRETQSSQDRRVSNTAVPDHASSISSWNISTTPEYWNSGQITEVLATQPIVHEAKLNDNIKQDDDHWQYSNVFSETTSLPNSAFTTKTQTDHDKEENDKGNINNFSVSSTSSIFTQEKTGINNEENNLEEERNFDRSDVHSKNGENDHTETVHSLGNEKLRIINSSQSKQLDIAQSGKLGDKSQSQTDTPPYTYATSDFSSKNAHEAGVNTNDYSNVTNLNTLAKSQLVNYNDSFEKDTASNLSPSKGRLKYKLPRYSQSFTFVERYQEMHNKNRTNPRLHKSRTRQHRHRQHQSSSQNLSGHRNHDNLQTTEHEAHSSHNKHTELERNSGTDTKDRDTKDTDEYGDVDGDQDRKEDTERGHRISEFGTTSQTNRNSKHGASEMQHSNGDEQVSREMRLRDRNLLMEERRRRMEEQRQRYNERLREYQETLRQRQHAIDESRRQDSHAAQRATPEDNGNTRNVHHPDAISSSSSSSSSHGAFSASKYNGRSPPVDDSAQSSQSRFAASNTDSRGYNTGHNPDTLRQGQVQQRPREYPQAETSNRRHTAHQPHRDTDNSYENTQLSGGYTSSNHKTRDSSRVHAPIVVQPPRLEYSDTFNVDGANSHGQQNNHRTHSSEPRYVPASRAALQSAINGHDTSNGQSVNQISSQGHIAPNRQLTGPGQFGSDSQSNQIPLETVRNTHNAIYEWRISGLTECTHSCGGGVQQTVVVCVDTITQAVVTDDNCRHLQRPDQLAMPCNTRPCSAEWTPGPWSPCSVTCGNGEQTRMITCQARVSPTLNMTMSSSSCEGQERIASRQTCTSNPCSSWRVGIWSNCSSPCGDGQKTRDVQCIDLDQQVISDNACSELKPDSEERCNLGECGKGWFFTEWPAECPVECGTGELTRQVFCADDTGSALPDSRCDVTQRPAVSQPCRVSRPCGGLWFTGQWLKCDSKCGTGNRHREVLCIKELPGSVHAVVGEENCEGSEKPEVTEPCEGPPCESEWYMTSWSQCSQSCGTGYRSREVKCLDSEQKLQEDCSVNTKPKIRDACNINSCDDVEDKNSEEDPSCTDKFAQCKVVKRARLCRYDYYKTVCCKSCAAET